MLKHNNNMHIEIACLIIVGDPQGVTYNLESQHLILHSVAA